MVIFEKNPITQHVYYPALQVYTNLSRYSRNKERVMRTEKKAKGISQLWKHALNSILLMMCTTGGAVATNVIITGTVIAPLSCSINNDQNIIVNFGSDLLTTQVDGNNYMKTIVFTLVCKNNTSNAFKLQVQGTQTDFNNSALKTNQADLGVAILADGQPLPVNGWVKFTYPNPPLLQAVPVKREGGTLKSGVFTASAVLMVDYQ